MSLICNCSAAHSWTQVRSSSLSQRNLWRRCAAPSRSWSTGGRCTTSTGPSSRTTSRMAGKWRSGSSPHLSSLHAWTSSQSALKLCLWVTWLTCIPYCLLWTSWRNLACNSLEKVCTYAHLSEDLLTCSQQRLLRYLRQGSVDNVMTT